MRSPGIGENSGGRGLRLHFCGVVIHQRLGDAAGIEVPLGNLRYGSDFGRRPSNETFGKARKLVRHNATFDHLEAAFARKPDDGLPRDAVKETVGYWRVNFAVLHKENIGT